MFSDTSRLPETSYVHAKKPFTWWIVFGKWQFCAYPGALLIIIENINVKRKKKDKGSAQ